MEKMVEWSPQTQRSLYYCRYELSFDLDHTSNRIHQAQKVKFVSIQREINYNKKEIRKFGKGVEKEIPQGRKSHGK
jgi:hypothetical protein